MTPSTEEERRDEQAEDNASHSGSPIRIVDTATEAPLGRRVGVRHVIIIFVFLVIPFIVVSLLTKLLNVHPFAQTLLAVVVVGLYAFLVYYGFDPKPETLSRTVARLGAERAISESMNHPVAINAHKGIARMLGAFAAHGERGVVYRFLPSSDLGRIEPIRVPFEPAMLDESDARIAELMNTTSGESTSPSTPLNRNVRRAGGWVIVCIFAFNVAIHLFRSFTIRRVTWELVWWSALFLFMFFGMGRSWMLPTFFAVPGGIVARKLRGIRRDTAVHVYTAADSVLCAYRATKNLWVLCVADGANAQWTSCAPAEARFAMATWLSPVPPPAKEQLSEL